MDNIDILLIPPILNPVLFSEAKNFIPVGLLSLVASVKNAGFTGEIFKPSRVLLQTSDYTSVAEEILSQKPRIIGFSTWCHTFPNALLLADELNRIDTTIPILFGGPHASALDRETIEQYPCIDFIIKGEADNGLPLLMRYILDRDPKIGLDQIDGLTYRDQKNKRIIHQNTKQGFVEDLDTNPVPAYDLLVDKANLRMDIGRGCPYACTFCSTNQFFSKKYRMKSVNRIMDEMEYCNQTMGAEYFGFSHDTLTLNNDYINELCDHLTEKNASTDKPFSWSCSSRIDCVTMELLTKMFKSGCRAIFFGIESGSPHIQKIIRKNLDLDHAYDIVDHAIQLGMHVTVSYIIGFPEETQLDIELTLKSIIKMTLLGAEPQVALLSVLPGTQLYKEYVDQLEWDGKTFGMTGSFLSEPVIKLIKQNRNLFSPFYYLPNKAIQRNELVFISNTVNHLSLFLPTLKVLRKFIIEDLNNESLFEHIINQITEYQDDKENNFLELFFLSKSIHDYCKQLISKGLENYVLDVVKSDITKAYMLIKYNKWQYLRAGGNSFPDQNRKIALHDHIKVIPVWKIISTKYDILHIIENAGRFETNKDPEQKNCSYIVLPISGTNAKLFEISEKNIRIVDQLKDMSVSDLVGISFKDDKKKAFKYLRWFMKLGMIEILPEKKNGE